jgi:nitroreductase
MNVSDAVLARKSIRAFDSAPVQDDLIAHLLEKSSRAASGGNLQPWKIYVINNEAMKSFLSFQETWATPESPSYNIYPPKLKEPYRTSRFQLGEQMYSLLNIPRENKEARINQVMENFKFFGAPVGLFCFVDKQMGPPQWSDLGMFLQTFMLLAVEAGLDTCAQEAWAMKSESVTSFVNSPDEEMLFCGMALGYRKPDARINQLNSERRSAQEWVKFL